MYTTNVSIPNATCEAGERQPAVGKQERVIDSSRLHHGYPEHSGESSNSDAYQCKNVDHKRFPNGLVLSAI